MSGVVPTTEGGAKRSAGADPDPPAGGLAAGKKIAGAFAPVEASPVCTPLPQFRAESAVAEFAVAAKEPSAGVTSTPAAFPAEASPGPAASGNGGVTTDDAKNAARQARLGFTVDGLRASAAAFFFGEGAIPAPLGTSAGDATCSGPPTAGNSPAVRANNSCTSPPKPCPG